MASTEWKVGDRVKVHTGHVAIIERIEPDHRGDVYFYAQARFDADGRKLPKWARTSYVLIESDLVPIEPPTSRPAATPAAVLSVDVAALPRPADLADEFREIEQFMAISGKFHLTEVAGKMTLLPRVPLAIDCDDDGFSFVSGGLG